MAKVKFDRNAKHKNIGEIQTTTKGDPLQLYNDIYQAAVRQHAGIYASWEEYQKLDGKPEKE